MCYLISFISSFDVCFSLQCYLTSMLTNVMQQVNAIKVITGKGCPSTIRNSCLWIIQKLIKRTKKKILPLSLQGLYGYCIQQIRYDGIHSSSTLHASREQGFILPTICVPEIKIAFMRLASDDLSRSSENLCKTNTEKCVTNSYCQWEARITMVSPY